jgi:hypothetical protein
MSGDDAVYNHALAVTPSDTVNLATPTHALLVGSSGVVQAVFQNGAVVALTVTGPIVLPVKVMRVNATSTTATGLVALYAV